MHLLIPQQKIVSMNQLGIIPAIMLSFI